VCFKSCLKDYNKQIDNWTKKRTPDDNFSNNLAFPHIKIENLSSREFQKSRILQGIKSINIQHEHLKYLKLIVKKSASNIYKSRLV
jgi:hypothetical protein